MLLFKVVSRNGDLIWLITNREPGSVPSGAVDQENGIGWQIEQMHRELKQWLGTERFPCRKARAWRKTLYAARSSLFEPYLRAELRQPSIAALNTT